MESGSVDTPSLAKRAGLPCHRDIVQTQLHLPTKQRWNWHFQELPGRVEIAQGQPTEAIGCPILTLSNPHFQRLHSCFPEMIPKLRLPDCSLQVGDVDADVLADHSGSTSLAVDADTIACGVIGS